MGPTAHRAAMPTPPYLAALLLLLAACSKPPEERAKASALHLLRHQLGPTTKTDSASLKVYPFSKAQMGYYASEIAAYGDGYLVTFDATTATPGGPKTAKRATFVADDDSAIFFLPLQHQTEFARQFGVPSPAAP